MAIVRTNWNPGQRFLRQFGFANGAIMGLFGLWIHLHGGLFGFRFPDAAETVTIVLWALAGASLLASLAAPAANKPLYLFLAAVTFPIGFLVSYAILIAIFFLLVTPIGLGMRLLGKDPLARKFDRGAPSYWVVRGRRHPAGRYFRQY